MRSVIGECNILCRFRRERYYVIWRKVGKELIFYIGFNGRLGLISSNGKKIRDF